jgi:O-antigen ligase
LLYDSTVARRTKKPTPSTRKVVRKRVWLLVVAFFLVQLVVLPGADSPFRTPKTVLSLIALMSIAGFSWAGQLARGRIRFCWSPLAATLLCLPLIQLVSASWSSSPRLALAAAAQTAIWIIGALWIATLDDEDRLRLVRATAVGAAISGAVLIAQAAGVAVFSLGPAGPSGRLNLTGLTGNPADLSMAAVLLLPLVFAAPGSSDRPWVRWVLAVLLTAAAAVSQTLTAIFALAVVWSVWLVQTRSRRLWAASAAAAALVIAVGLWTGLDTRIEGQLRRLHRGDWYLMLSARSDGWSAAGEMVRARPVSGVGASNFTRAYYPSRIAWLERTESVGRRTELATHFRFAHCDPLQVIAELGVPGTVWLVALVVVAFRYRPRGDPLFLLAAAAFLPFAVLHFPGHLAVGILPMILVIGHLIAQGREIDVTMPPWTRFVASVLAVVAVLIGIYWQLYGLTLNLWRGGLTHSLSVMQTLEKPQRAQHAAAIEAQILPRIAGLGGARPWLWRMVGQARLAREDDAGAETAFRNALILWPHEEAEFGLGLALAAQDRGLVERGVTLDGRNLRGKAIVHLARVCRTNPALLELIEEDDLRRAVSEIVGVTSGRRRSHR